MKRRLFGYLALGALFGAFDFVYLGFLRALPADRLFGAGPLGRSLQLIVTFGVLNLGIWLIPAVPAALYEARRSGSRALAALASLLVWVAGIVAYYLAYGAQFALGVPGREEMALAQIGAPRFWANWGSLLRHDVLGGMIEYMLLAVVGGAVVGLVVGSLSMRRADRRGA
jgi:hypothetical protein